jgi:hypothetical protein
LEPESAMYACRRSGVTATSNGWEPTGMGLPTTVLVAVSIVNTVFEPLLAT